MSTGLLLVQTLNGLQFGILLFLVAAGLTLVFGVMDFVNLAHGVQYMVGAYFAATFTALTGNLFLGLLLTLPAALAFGLLLEVLIFRHLYDRDHLEQVLATFGLILFLNQAVKFVWGAAPLSVPVPELLSGSLRLGDGILYPVYRIAIIAAGMSTALLLYVLTTRTRIGMLVRAGATNAPMVAALGIDIRRLFMIVYRLDPRRVHRSPADRPDRHARPFVRPAAAEPGPGTGRRQPDRAIARPDADLHPHGSRSVRPSLGTIPGQTMTGARIGRHWGPGALFVALALVPVAAQFGAEGYLLSLATRALIFAIAALSLDLILGFGALVSFGHAAFLGIGAYAVGILSAHGVSDLLVQSAVALVAAAIFAAATGAISLRTTGVYYIMISLAFGQMLFFLAVSLSAYGGDDGLTLDGRSTLFGLPLLKTSAAFYYLALGTLGAAYLLARAIVGSRFGRVLIGAAQNPTRMRAIGFEPYRYQLIAYIISGMICALAGVLLANQSEFVSPAYMTWQRSGELLVMVILGGVGTLYGALLGAGTYLLLEDVLSGFTEHWKMIFGPLLILVVLYGRGGLAGILARFERGGADG
jgi:branched-chain amino acid transport system permease protein